MSIPKVIHYCWFGGNPLPKSAKKCMNSWEKYCPDYKIVRWDESNFNIKCSPYCEKMYNEKMEEIESCPHPAEVIYVKCSEIPSKYDLLRIAKREE